MQDAAQLLYSLIPVVRDPILLVGYAIMMYHFPSIIMELSDPGESFFFHVILYAVLPIGLLGFVCRWIWKKQCQYIYEKVVVSHMLNE